MMMSILLALLVAVFRLNLSFSAWLSTIGRFGEGLCRSWRNYALPVWGAAVYQNSLFIINHLHNRAVHTVCGLHKSDHVSRHCQASGWLSVPLLTQHRTLCAMLDQCTCQGILLNPPIQFGRYHTHNTRCPVHFAVVAQCRLAQ